MSHGTHRIASRLIVGLIVLSACASPRPVVTLSEADTRDWIQLFNGRDLTNWVPKFTGYELGLNLRETFRVEDGLLKVRYDRWNGFDGEFGHLFYTSRPFSHYIIAVEYRFVGAQVRGAGTQLGWAVRNNGIMIHSQPPDTMGLRQDFPISLEVQLLGGLADGRDRATANLCTPGTHVVMHGALVTEHCVSSTSRTFPGDEWVRVEALVLGDSVIRHIVNGDTVLVYSSPRMRGGAANEVTPGILREGKPLTGGFIALQAETAPIDFRKVEVLNLEGCTDPNSITYKRYFVRSDSTVCFYAAPRGGAGKASTSGDDLYKVVRRA